jgi:hypothetical protein
VDKKKSPAEAGQPWMGRGLGSTCFRDYARCSHRRNDKEKAAQPARLIRALSGADRPFDRSRSRQVHARRAGGAGELQPCGHEKAAAMPCVIQLQGVRQLGVTNQQVHKFDTGENRIFAGQLLATARLFGLAVADFSNGYDGGAPLRFRFATPRARRGDAFVSQD